MIIPKPYLSISSSFINDADKLFDFTDGWPSEILNRDQGPFQFWKCVVWRKLVRRQRYQVVNALRYQESQLQERWILNKNKMKEKNSKIKRRFKNKNECLMSFVLLREQIFNLFTKKCTQKDY